MEEDQDDISPCSYTKAKAYCPIGLLQKMMKKQMNRNIRVKTLGCIPYVYNNLPTHQRTPRKPQRTMWLHIYRKSFTWAFLNTEVASDSISRDITKNATWRGLETLTSDELAPCCVVENLPPRSNETLWSGLWSRAVHRGTFYYPIAVKPVCRRIHTGTHECQLYTGVWAILITRTFQKMSHSFIRRVWVWNSGMEILGYHSIHRRSSTSTCYETRTLRWYLLAGHCYLFKLLGAKCTNVRAAKED